MDYEYKDPDEEEDDEGYYVEWEIPPYYDDYLQDDE